MRESGVRGGASITLILTGWRVLCEGLCACHGGHDVGVCGMLGACESDCGKDGEAENVVSRRGWVYMRRAGGGGAS